MKFLFFFLFIITLGACNQVMLGTGHALKNAVTLPLEGLRHVGGLITGENHRSYVQRTYASENHRPEILSCVDGSSVDDLSTLMTILEEARETLCLCRPWGDCPAPLCSCDILCPNHLEFLIDQIDL